MRKSKEMNMTQGNLYKQIIIYALPLIATNILQLLFNAADVAVLSIFAQDGDLAIAAVGSTGAIVNLVIGLLWDFRWAQTCLLQGVWECRTERAQNAP